MMKGNFQCLNVIPVLLYTHTLRVKSCLLESCKETVYKSDATVKPLGGRKIIPKITS